MIRRIGSGGCDQEDVIRFGTDSVTHLVTDVSILWKASSLVTISSLSLSPSMGIGLMRKRSTMTLRRGLLAPIATGISSSKKSCAGEGQEEGGVRGKGRRRGE